MYKIFQDLDGCLADFDKRIVELTGKHPSELKAKELWGAAARDDRFFANLEWMPNGQKLWNYIKGYNPEILTGIPYGKWAPGQKREWCVKHLGPEVVVHTVFSKDKWKEAQKAVDDKFIPVLIDDTLKLKKAWEDVGGIFIHHNDANIDATINELKDLGL